MVAGATGFTGAAGAGAAGCGAAATAGAEVAGRVLVEVLPWAALEVVPSWAGSAGVDSDADALAEGLIDDVGDAEGLGRPVDAEDGWVAFVAVDLGASAVTLPP